MDSDAPLTTLLAAVARGEHAALRAVYDREGKRLFGVAMAILRDRPTAADAVQDAFLKIWQRAGQFDPARGEGRAWLSTVVRHAALDLARARGREQPTGEAALDVQSVEPDVVERLGEHQDAVRLHECLSQLDERNRQFIILAFVHGMSHAQIAAKQNRPLGSVKTWIRRGLLTLRECLT